MKRFGIIFVLFGFLTAACHSPSAASAPVPKTALDGGWTGEQMVTSVDGGECLASLIQEVVRYPSQFHATIAQAGSRVTATIDIDHVGAVCTYEGSIDGTTIDLKATSCSPSKQIGLRCATGELRDILNASGTLHATVADDVITGLAVETDNVVESGTRRVVSPLVLTSTATLTRQR